jgi:transcriptional regulator with XRE-family HTH domain
MNFYGMSDKAILRELGRRVRQKRLAKNLTQESLAKMAGVSRITIGNLEKGQAVTLLTFVQVLHSLGSLDGLESFLPDLGPSPLQVAKMKGKKRQKASGGSKRSPWDSEGSRW